MVVLSLCFTLCSYHFIKRKKIIGIVYGNSARLLKENEQIVKNGSKYTHEWTFYVKPYNDSWDMSALLREVVFVTDPVYPSTRLTQAPYQVTHIGWGEYNASVQLFFNKPFSTKRPLVLYHTIILVQSLSQKNASPATQEGLEDRAQNYIVVPFIQTEYYDEIVVTSPTPEQRDAIGRAYRGNVTIGPECPYELPRERTIAKIKSVKKEIEAEIARMKKEILANIRECKELRSSIVQLNMTNL
ncbi:YEATS domain-containing protein 4-like isoform X2 [Varroa jacobsoni]|uniref:YEATS domain-containing protein 4-like isoform X2 n=1 Tax=Varroa jacobsoni TaxID=62625 RepID=UPI000BF59785|nr:YEATS domain-containing protein 4-like isoform X2 [Varroa jacobsoni]